MRSHGAIEGDLVGSPLNDYALIRLVELLRAQGYRFTTVTPVTQARVNARPENALASDIAGIFGWSRPFRAEMLSEEILSAMRNAGVLQINGTVCRSSVRVSSYGDLLFVHSAYPTTSADAVFFGPDTVRFANLIGCHLATRKRPIGRAVDIGCGAGPGGIVVARAWPDASVFNLDINEAALRLARINAAVNGARNVAATRSDLLDGVDGKFDLIVSNPPYLIDPNMRAYRHGGGEFGEGLSLRILEQAIPRLTLDGTLVLYTGSAIKDGRDGFKIACQDLFDRLQATCIYEELDPDVFGEELENDAYRDIDRIAVVAVAVTNLGRP